MNISNINKYIKIGKYVILAICVLVSLLFFLMNDDSGEILFITTYVLLGAAILLLIGFYIQSLIQYPHRIKFVGIGIVAAAALVGICYLLSDATTVGLAPELARTTSDAAIRWTETGIYLAYILAAAAILSLAVTGIRNSIKG